jgi:hypothetical protein
MEYAYMPPGTNTYGIHTYIYTYAYTPVHIHARSRVHIEHACIQIWHKRVFETYLYPAMENYMLAYKLE